MADVEEVRSFKLDSLISLSTSNQTMHPVTAWIVAANEKVQTNNWYAHHGETGCELP